MDEIVQSFKKTIQQRYFDEYKDIKELILKESNNQINYEFKFSISNPKNHLLVIKDLEKLKVEGATYIHKDPPEDCDYIILDLIKKIIYFIELKKKKHSSLDSAGELRGQLLSGRYWLNHLLFCTRNENILIDKNWSSYWAVFNHRNARSGIKVTVPQIIYKEFEKALPVFEGCNFFLEDIKRYRK